MKKIVIAIDGHSSCGKSTMAKDLAREIGYIYVDSGAMYRAVTLYALRHGFFRANGELDAAALEAALPQVTVSFRLDDDTRLPRTLLNGEDVEEAIRTLDVSARVSVVAAQPAVRTALMRAQQELGREKGIVMDGRDIGTAVFPQAELKIFVTASAEVRAQRRFDELRAKGQDVSYDDVLANVKERDYIDSHRAMNPLRQAADARVLDNSQMSIAEQKEWLLAQFRGVAGETHAG